MVDKPTFERIVQDHGSFVRRTLAHLGVVARHIADVEQEVFRGVHRGLPTFDPSLAANPENAMRAWLFGICARQAASHRRAEMRRAEVLLSTDDLDGERDEKPDSEDSYVAAERRALLFELLATLEPRRRAVIIAYELEGMEMAEVAESIGIPVNTCWNRLRLARADLRAAWARMSAQKPSRKRVEASMVPFAFLAGAGPLGWIERATWLVRSAREWLSHEWLSRERLSREWLSRRWKGLFSRRRTLSLGRAAAPLSVAAVVIPALGVLSAALALSSEGSMVTAAGSAVTTPGSANEAVSEAAIARERALGVAGVRSFGAAVSVPFAAVPEVPSLKGAVRRRPVHDRRPTGGGSVEGGTGTSIDVRLREETMNLGGVRTAYQSGDARLATRLLDHYERTFPNGRMQASSMLLRLRLLMSLGCRNEAREKARLWLAEHPESADRPLIVQIVGELD